MEVLKLILTTCGAAIVSGLVSLGIASINAKKEKAAASKGSKNKMLVKVLQTILKHKGYSIGFTGVDGDFGSATYNALIKFQKNNSINADGICGMDTWDKLFKE